nr:unnamed protein product [Digitaria exilis]
MSNHRSQMSRLAQGGTSPPMEQTETARPAAATRGARTHDEIRRPGEGFLPELRHSSLSLCNHSPMNKARNRAENYSWLEELLSHTDLSRELDMRGEERMMEDTLALMVASSRALLGASPPAASAAAGLRWGEGNGRKAAAEGGEGSGTLD